MRAALDERADGEEGEGGEEEEGSKALIELLRRRRDAVGSWDIEL